MLDEKAENMRQRDLSGLEGETGRTSTTAVLGEKAENMRQCDLSGLKGETGRTSTMAALDENDENMRQALHVLHRPLQRVHAFLLDS